MAKLSNDEVQKLIEHETGMKLPQLPRDAHSVFQFEIKESPEKLFERIQNPSKKSWVYYSDKENPDISYMRDPYFDSHATVEKQNDGSLKITTAMGGYEYKITPNVNGGSNVEFKGPMNALLQQNLLPEMSYVPHTLEAKFVDSKSGKDLTDYLDMHTYGVLRAKKNKQIIKDNYRYETVNNKQDQYGYWVNKKFNNEIDFLPQHESEQERMLKISQERYGKPINVSGVKSRLLERRKELDDKKSGVVKADERSDAVRSGMKIPSVVRDAER